jgi:vancomycin resistance protein YoaR
MSLGKLPYQKTLLVLFLLFGAGVLAVIASESFASDRIARGVSVAGIDLGGTLPADAKRILTEAQLTYEERSLEFIYPEHEWKITTGELGVVFDIETTVQSAYAFTHRRDPFTNMIDRVILAVRPRDIPLAATIDRTSMDEAFRLFTVIEDAPVSADLEYIDGTFRIIPSASGRMVFQDALAQVVTRRVARLSSEPINLSLVEVAPELRTHELALMKNLFTDNPLPDLEIHHEDRTWNVTGSTLLSWVSLAPSPFAEHALVWEDAFQAKPAASQDRVHQLLGAFARDRARDSLVSRVSFVVEGNGDPLASSSISPHLHTERAAGYFAPITTAVKTDAKNVRLTMRDGEVEVLEDAVPGTTVDIDATLAAIARAIAQQESRVALRVRALEPEITKENIADLGITELVGRGTSQFAGSSGNRIHNIAEGTSRFQGLLVAPGEEVSAGKTIGEVDRAHGFLPELVILANETVPQDGGGLCQVTSTLFRATMDAGLEVTARRNHSYSVSHYSPAGTDATIYYPHTDYKFRNDSPHWMFIQTHINGTELVFEFYGTKDGRTVELGTPRHFDFGPGGALKAVWERKVHKDGELIHDDSFFSNYRSKDLFPTESQRRAKEQAARKAAEEEAARKAAEEQRKKEQAPVAPAPAPAPAPTPTP